MRRTSSLAAACGAIAIVWAAWSAPVSAGTLQVNPVLVEIDAARRTATVTVRNQEAAPVTIRAYPLAWSQDEGEDAYAESSALIVSPPIFTIPPGGTQLVRVGLRAPSGTPAAYRLIIEEVPEASPGDGIRVALRLNLPLYASLPPGDAAALSWSAEPASGGGWLISARNGGEGYIRLNREMAREATGIAFEDTVNFGTVLPGASRRWRIGPDTAIEDGARLRQVRRMASDVAAQDSH